MKIQCFDRENGFLAGFDVTPASPFARLPLNESILNRSKGLLVLRFDVPVLDFFGYWTPDMTRPVSTLAWRVSLLSAFQRNFPFLTFFSRNGHNAFTCALSSMNEDVELDAAMNQQRAVYEITFRIAVVPETSPFDLLLSFDKDPRWEDMPALYRAALGVRTPDYPRSAFASVYCTWYAAHAALTESMLLENAAEAASLGFGTYIVDDGWCTDAPKRVTPETLPTWYNEIGDWRPSESKLPGLARTVREIQSKGLKCLFWVAPFFLGTDSAAYRAVRDPGHDLYAPVQEGKQVLDPAVPELAEDSLRAVLRPLASLGLDGLKVDFIDYVPCGTARPRSHVVRNYVERLAAGIREIRPDALIEFRQRYATPATLPFATQFRAGDVPFDAFENLHRVAQIRMILGDGVPVHADPVYFHPDESAENIAMHMKCALAGVPMISMDLKTLRPEARRVVAEWLAFYETHRALFEKGHWTVRYDGAQLDCVIVENETESVLFAVRSDAAERYPANPELRRIVLAI